MGLPGINGNEPTAPMPDPGARTPPPRPQQAAAAEGAPRPRASPEAPQDPGARRVVLDPPVKRAGTRLRVDKASKRIIAQILDEHNEVLKQIPPEEVLKVAARIRRLQGLLLDEQA
ncbi:MAG TPA: flagellar protein FlaG [Candidatus Hydrogenedentes bacterium]|nr:flagellar protein FlaG [Candidatus Hydrogenedentota bacterium]